MKNSFSSIHNFFIQTRIYLVASGFYIASALIAFRKLLLSPGIIGHQWDWSVPPFPYYLKNIATSGLYLWQENFLGSGMTGYQLPSNLFGSSISALAYLGLEGEQISKIILLLSTIFSGLFMFILMKGMLEDVDFSSNGKYKVYITYVSALFSGFFFAFSPYLFSELIGGAVTLIGAYTFMPLVVHFSRRLFITKKVFYAFALALTLSVVLIVLAYFIIAIVLIILLMPLYPHLRKSLKSFLIMLLMLALLNAYTLIPVVGHVLFLGVREASTYGQLYSDAILLNRIRGSVPSLWQLMIGDGFLDRNWFIEVMRIESTLWPLWCIVSFSLVSIFLGLLMLKLGFLRKGRKQVIFWMSLFTLATAIAAGGKGPLGPVVEIIYVEGVKNSILSPFRSTIRLLMLPALTLAIVLGFAICSTFHSLPLSKLKIKKIIFGTTIMLILVMNIWLYPSFSGNLGYDSLKFLTPGNQVSTYTLSPGYQKVFSILNSDLEWFRVLSLPMVYSPLYHETEFQNVGQGGDPLVIYSPHPMPVEESEYLFGRNILLSSLQRAIYFDSYRGKMDLSKLLGLLSVKYVVLREDIYPYFSPYAYLWNYTKIKNFLKSTETFDLIVEEDDILLFKNKEFAPSVYGVTSVKLTETLWTHIRGEWQVIDNNTIIGGLDSVLRTNWVYSNFTMQATLRLDNSTYNGYILWRVEDLNNYYYLGVEGKDWFVVGKKLGGIQVPVETRFEVPHATDIRVELVSSGDIFEVRYKFGQETDWRVIRFSDSSIRSGYVVLRAWDNISTFKKIKIGPDSNNLREFGFGPENLDAPMVVNSDNFFVGKSVFIDTAQNEGETFLLREETVAPNVNRTGFFSYIRLTPTRYIVTVKNDAPFYLILNQNYDNNWEATANGRPVKHHFIVNGYSNGWIINSTGDFQIDIDYKPQIYVDTGLYISVATLILSNSWLIIEATSGTGHKKNRLRNSIEHFLKRLSSR